MIYSNDELKTKKGRKDCSFYLSGLINFASKTLTWFQTRNLRGSARSRADLFKNHPGGGHGAEAPRSPIRRNRISGLISVFIRKILFKKLLYKTHHIKSVYFAVLIDVTVNCLCTVYHEQIFLKCNYIGCIYHFVTVYIVSEPFRFSSWH